MHFSRLFGLLENAIKSQLYRFTTMNLGNPTTRAFHRKVQAISLGFYFSVFGVVVVERFIVVNSHSFENDPRGRRKTDHFCPVEERWEAFCQESGASTTFKCVPRTTPKIAILKPQVAGLRLSKNSEYGQGCGGKRSRWARFVAHRSWGRCPCPLAVPFSRCLRLDLPSSYELRWNGSCLRGAGRDLGTISPQLLMWRWCTPELCKEHPF